REVGGMNERTVHFHRKGATPMKRVSIAVMALIICMAVALVPQAAAKKKVKKFPATISLAIQRIPATTYTSGSSTLSGTIASGGPAQCRAGRSVTVTGPPGNFPTSTNATGAYRVDVQTFVPNGTYSASTPKVVVKKKNKNTGVVKKKVCKPGSTSVTL